MIEYAVNNYVWALLKKHRHWSKIDGRVPMIPAQQQPEFMNFQKPFIVYGFTNEHNSGELEPEDSTVIHYLIYAQTEEEVDESINLIKNAFKAENSQENLNSWFRSSDNADIADADKDAFAQYTEVMNTISAGGTDEEGGWKDGLISVRVGYKTNPVSYAI